MSILSVRAGFCALLVVQLAMLPGKMALAASPDESRLSDARELRGQGKYEDALKILDTLDENPASGRDVSLTRAMVLAESGKIEEATMAIARLLATNPRTVEVNLAAAYIYRLAGKPVESLAASLRVLSREPDNREAYQYQVFALSDLNANGRALTLAEARPEFFSRNGLIKLSSDRAARQILWGQIKTPGQPAKRYQATDQALDMLGATQERLLERQPEDTPGARLRLRRDRVLALRQRDRMADAIEEFEALERDDPAIRSYPYVLEAAADAYLYQGRPKRATELYQRVLDGDPDNYNARSALYFALLESERFREAIDLIDTLVAEQPMFRSGQSNWDKLYLDTTAAMARAMANRPDQTQRRLQALLDDAPASASLHNELATVYRWRGWPHRALEESEIASAYEPDEKAVQRVNAATLMDLERYPEAGKLIQSLYRDYPEDLQIQRLHNAWQDRRRWGLQMRGEYGDSDGDSIAFGSSDRSLRTRLDAPWIAHHWRPYATHYYAEARFPDSDAEYDRVGFGLQWRKRRHNAYAEVNRNRSGSSEAGLTAGYDFHLGDHWSVATRYESFSTEVPLLARNAGLDGNRAEAAVRWTAHESFNTRLGVSRLSISDGNVRYAGLWSVNKRLFASAHHVTEGRLDLYGSRASQSGGPYFNPQRDASVTLGLRHDWLTWRRYERSFTQRVTLAGGRYWQRGFGTHSISDLGYEHEWKLSRNLRLRYSIGASNRVYDGERERRTYGLLELEVLF